MSVENMRNHCVTSLKFVLVKLFMATSSCNHVQNMRLKRDTYVYVKFEVCMLDRIYAGDLLLILYVYVCVYPFANCW